MAVKEIVEYIIKNSCFPEDRRKELADPNTRDLGHYNLSRGVGMILCPGTIAKLRQGTPRLFTDLGILLEPTVFGIAISGRVPEVLRKNLETCSAYNICPKIYMKISEPLSRMEVDMTSGSDSGIEGEPVVEGEPKNTFIGFIKDISDKPRW